MKRLHQVRILLIMISISMLTSCGKIDIQIKTDGNVTPGETEKTSEDKDTQDKVDKDTQEKEDNKIPENATMVDMDTLKKDYCVVLSKDKDWYIDLDGDGTNEVIRYSAYGNDVLFTINGSEINYENIEKYGGLSFVELYDEFAIVDLDNTDNKYQIAVSNDGFSADPNSEFFIYENEKLEYIGSAYEEPSTMKFNVDNMPGKFEHCIIINAIQTTEAIQYIQYDKVNKTLTPTEEDYYKYVVWDRDQDGDVYDTELLKDLTVYKKDDKTSGKLTMKAQEVCLDTVRFIFENKENKDDYNSYWVLIKAKDGAEGWVYVEDRPNGEKINGTLLTEYFGELYCG